MLIDNSPAKRAYRYIEGCLNDKLLEVYLKDCQNEQRGRFDIVTGYFSLAGMEWLASITAGKVSRFRFVIGDYQEEKRVGGFATQLFEEDLCLGGLAALRQSATRVVAFLESEHVEVKTVQPSLCHAKVYILQFPGLSNGFYMMGSSNLSLPALGIAATSNIEINMAEAAGAELFNGYAQWFERLFASANFQRVDESGNSDNFKQWLISRIRQVFIEYEPHQVYCKLLSHWYADPDFLIDNSPRARGALKKLEETTLWKTLYPFQRDGALGMINMLQKYGGGILGDAVGLGKTWEALAVIHFFARQGYDVWVFCPKRLHGNWEKYRQVDPSIKFQDCEFDYHVRFHTDLQGDLLDRKGKLGRDLQLRHLRTDRPRLFVIDESHNFRNGPHFNNEQPNRYAFFMQEILEQNPDSKVLMLTATPLNNRFDDLKHQFLLAAKGNDAAFRESLSVHSVKDAFKKTGKLLQQALDDDGNALTALHGALSDNLQQLLYGLLLARTRDMITEGGGLTFPKRGILRDENNDQREDEVNVTPLKFGEFQTFEDVANAIPKRLSAYLPARYLRPRGSDETTTEEQQEFQLARMMQMLLLKRLESSWWAFYISLKNIRASHEEVRDNLIEFRDSGIDKAAGVSTDQLEAQRQESEDDDDESLAIGKRRIQPSEIAAVGNLDIYIEELTEDIAALNKLIDNLEVFEQQVEAEKSPEGNRSSADVKLAELIELIEKKPQLSKNASPGRDKILIFTSFKDTAKYLFEQLRHRGFENVAMVAGDESLSWDKPKTRQKDYNDLLKRFCPHAQLYRESEWAGFDAAKDEAPAEAFIRWQDWIVEHRPDVKRDYLDRPIDILIATDCISEGQNLQDCDTVANYDVHYNPVRIIQRFGRIDRLGSLNDEVYCVTFWPADSVEETLRLRRLISAKMLGMTVAGSEIHDRLTSDLKDAVDGAAEVKQQLEERMLQKIAEGSLDELDDKAQAVCAELLASQTAQMDHLRLYNSAVEEARGIPHGVFTGFQVSLDELDRDCIIALLGIPDESVRGVREYRSYSIVCVDLDGQPVIEPEAQVLNFLARHKAAERHVPDALDAGDPDALQRVSEALRAWRDSETATMSEKSSHDIDAIADALAGKTPRFDNPDVLCWFYVSSGTTA